jgi:dGTPase
LHSKTFRRLKHKTQVFLSPEGDHYRTRLTHTLEVSQIARTMARALRLNEDLTEAIALGHDLGHTPFGHAGERTLNEITPFKFTHYEQSLRVVDKLERDRKGMNLTYEVRNGIVTHTKGEMAVTLEGRLVRYADRIAYINHDIDDATRAGILSEEDIPYNLRYILGRSHSQRISTMIRAIISSSQDINDILMNGEIEQATNELHDFLFDAVYRNPAAKGEEGKAEEMIARLYQYFLVHPEKLPEEFGSYIETDGLQRIVCDYIAGMTDRYCVQVYSDLFIPKEWNI